MLAAQSFGPPLASAIQFPSTPRGPPFGSGVISLSSSRILPVDHVAASSGFLSARASSPRQLARPVRTASPLHQALSTSSGQPPSLQQCPSLMSPSGMCRSPLVLHRGILSPAQQSLGVESAIPSRAPAAAPAGTEDAGTWRWRCAADSFTPQRSAAEVLRKSVQWAPPDAVPSSGHADVNQITKASLPTWREHHVSLAEPTVEGNQPQFSPRPSGFAIGTATASSASRSGTPQSHRGPCCAASSGGIGRALSPPLVRSCSANGVEPSAGEVREARTISAPLRQTLQPSSPEQCYGAAADSPQVQVQQARTPSEAQGSEPDRLRAPREFLPVRRPGEAQVQSPRPERRPVPQQQQTQALGGSGQAQSPGLEQEQAQALGGSSWAQSLGPEQERLVSLQQQTPALGGSSQAQSLGSEQDRLVALQQQTQVSSDLQARVQELVRQKEELERKVDEDSQCFVQTLLGLEREVQELREKNRQLEEKSAAAAKENELRAAAALEEERQAKEAQIQELLARNAKLESDHQDSAQQFEAFEKERNEESSRVREEAALLQSQLLEQEQAFQRRLQEVERDRENLLQVMSDESKELQSRVEKLTEDKEAMSLDLARALARADLGDATASVAEGSPRESRDKERADALRRSQSECEVLKDEVAIKEGQLVLLRNQLEIAERKLRLSDMENTMLKSEFEACRRNQEGGGQRVSAAPAPEPERVFLERGSL